MYEITKYNHFRQSHVSFQNFSNISCLKTSADFQKNGTTTTLLENIPSCEIFCHNLNRKHYLIILIVFRCSFLKVHFLENTFLYLARNPKNFCMETPQRIFKSTNKQLILGHDQILYESIIRKKYMHNRFIVRIVIYIIHSMYKNKNKIY